MAQEEFVKQLLAQGFAFPCAMCRKLWRGKERGMEACEAALGGLDCGGPPSGQSFPLYEGPLTLHAIAMHCFVCGERAVEAVSTPAQPTRLVGVCKRHVPALDRLVVDNDLRAQKRASSA